MTYIIYITFVLAFSAIVFFFILNIRLNRLARKYNSFMKGLSDKDVEDMMTSYLDELEKLKNKVHTNINTRIEQIEKKLPGCIQHVGMVNYNAFDNVSNDMSFSIAAMDGRKNGFVISGIYSRDFSYVYSKEIRKGKPQRELSIEEVEAMNKAFDKFDSLK
ncbi:MAG: DUF4446 family protein [Clostridiaceae bacterium]|jgi:hypothetical protein|nr:DUF4446 family protein [Clostridiaceae bacterium]